MSNIKAPKEVALNCEREGADFVFSGAPGLSGVAEQAGVEPMGLGMLSLEQLMQLAESTQLSGQHEQTLALYEGWITQTADPRKFVALFNMGSLLQSLGKFDRALGSYTRCMLLAPEFPQAKINTGLILEQQGKHHEALRAWSEVVASQYTHDHQAADLVITALNHIGRLQEQNKNYDLAEKALLQSLELNPDQPHVIQHWVHVRQKACKWPAIKETQDLTYCQILQATSPLASLALFDDPVTQLLVAQSFVQRMYKFEKQALFSNCSFRHHKLRIGYVSGDLCVHAVGLLIADLFEAHDRSRFDIYAYDYSPEDGSTHRHRLQKSVNHWRDIRSLDDQAAIKQIMDDEIDVLIDLHGLSSGARPGIFAARPACLQGTYLGFIGTTSMTWFDFFITDRYAVSESSIAYFTEKPLFVDGCFLPLSKPRNIPVDGVQDHAVSSLQRADFGFQNEAFVMAAFGNVYKINASLFGAWMEILKQIPNAVLWMIDDNPDTRKNLIRHAIEWGVNEEKIKLSPRVSPDAFREQLKLADVFLDTYPYNCGATSNDVIAAGIPMVTCSGKTMVSRMGGSILSSLGMGHLIAQDLEEYKAKVIQIQQQQPGMQLKYPDDDYMTQSRITMVRSLEHELVKRHQQKQERYR